MRRCLLLAVASMAFAFHVWADLETQTLKGVQEVRVSVAVDFFKPENPDVEIVSNAEIKREVELILQQFDVPVVDEGTARANSHLDGFLMISVDIVDLPERDGRYTYHIEAGHTRLAWLMKADAKENLVLPTSSTPFVGAEVWSESYSGIANTRDGVLKSVRSVAKEFANDWMKHNRPAAESDSENKSPDRTRPK